MRFELLNQHDFEDVVRVLVFSLGAGVVLGLVFLVPALRFRGRRLLTENYSGRNIPVTGGSVIAASLVIWLIGVFLEFPGELLTGVRPRPGDLVVAGVLIGFFLLGLLDDMVGERESKGFRGHARALLKGRVTTGALKAGGGGVLALFLSASLETGSWVWVVVRALVIVLSANLLNLLDLRPGRALKVYLLAATGLGFMLGMRSGGEASAVYIGAAACLTGAAIVWMVPDLRELGMLGDSGSNMLGAALGTGMVLALSRPWQAAAAVILFALNLLSERWSFSNMIERVPPLKWFDGLGRKREETSSILG